MRFTLFVDRINLAAAAGATQKELDLSNIAVGRCAGTEALAQRDDKARPRSDEEGRARIGVA
jgi:hypothetical protein